MPQVTIAGAGLSGATLAYLFKHKGIDFEIYDQLKPWKCGIEPCAWGVNYKDFLKVCELLKLGSFKYILRYDDFAFLDGLKVKAGLATIDKPKLISDLLKGIKVKYTKPELSDSLLIDATGAARAYSQPLESDFRVLTTQRRVKLSQPVPPWAYWSPGVGYAWLIPLSADGIEAHLGAGALKNHDLQATINNLIERVKVKIGEVICSCGAWIRATGPILPMVNGNTVSIGEAAGLVSPLSGGGNIPAMLSAFSLAFNLSDPRRYEREMVHRFGYFRTEERVLKSLATGRVITPRSMMAMKRMLKFVGIHPTLPQYWRILQTIDRRIKV